MSSTDTLTFKKWAQEMGCPVELLPSEDILQRTFNTQQGRCLLELVRRVAPADRVSNMRQNILLHKLKTSNDAINKVEKYRSVEIQALKTIRENREELGVRRQQNDEKRKRLEALRESLNQLSQKQMCKSTEFHITQAHSGIMSAKINSLEQDLNREQSTSATITSLMPVQLNPLTHSLLQTNAAIGETIATLSDIYDSEFQDGDSNPIPLNATSPTWSRLQRIVQNHPNSLLWSAVRTRQEENLLKMKRIFKESSRLKYLVKDSSSEIIELYLVKVRAKHLSIELKRLSVLHELELSSEQFIQPYDDFLNRIHDNTDLDPDQVDEYVTELTMHFYNAGQLDFLTAQIEMREAELTERSDQLNKHTAVMAELQRVYADESRTFHQTRDECAAFYSIKQKLQCLEMSGKGLVFEARQTNNNNNNKQHRANKEQSITSGAGGDSSSSGSFNLSINGVLSSTRVDNCWPNENSILMTSVLEPPRNDGKAPDSHSAHRPQHLNELLAYVEGTPQALALHSSTNDTLQRIICENIPQINGFRMDLFRMQTIQRSIKQLCAWKSQLDSVFGRPSLTVDIPYFDLETLQKQAAALDQCLTNMEDQCHSQTELCGHKRATLERIYAFLKENQLRSFLPVGQTFNGRSYSDYEKEYSYWYNMVAPGGGTTRFKGDVQLKV